MTEPTAGAEPLPEHVAINRQYWDRTAHEWVAAGERSWATPVGQESWGVFGFPEADLRMLPDGLAGKDAIELGCGTGYVSSWLARRGARVVGIDNSAKQLETATRLRDEHGLDITFIHGNAERVPYPDASFDFAISEYGAVLWADPAVWVPEAARLLRPGGRLHVLTNSVIDMLCVPDDEDEPSTDRLVRSQFEIARVVWPDPDDESVEFHPTHGEWIRHFTSNGFEVLELLEPQAKPGLSSRHVPGGSAWASRWPVEEIWKVRKRA